jgi:hypothetical protein
MLAGVVPTSSPPAVPHGETDKRRFDWLLARAAGLPDVADEGTGAAQSAGSSPSIPLQRVPPQELLLKREELQRKIADGLKQQRALREKLWSDRAVLEALQTTIDSIYGAEDSASSAPGQPERQKHGGKASVLRVDERLAGNQPREESSVSRQLNRKSSRLR